MSGIAVSALSKRYGQTLALDDVTLDVAPGEFFGLLGPSGSGKTTLLRLIAGFETADAGTIEIGARRVESVPVERRRIGMVFQSYALFPNLNVERNVAFGLAVRGLPRARIRERVANALALVRLDAFGTRRPQELSGGQRQRVALARAIVTEPALLLLDEPLGALDKSLRQEMQFELRRIQRQTGLTTLFVTHDQEEALTISDRVGILRDGRLVQQGTPDALYDRPTSAFVATFLGDANLFDGTVDGNGVRMADGSHLIVDTGRRAQGQQATVAVRPERTRLVDAASQCATAGPTGINRVKTVVDAMTFTGAAVHYRLRQPGRDEPLLVSEPNDGRRRYAIGDRVVVHWPAEAGVLLGRASDDRPPHSTESGTSTSR